MFNLFRAAMAPLLALLPKPQHHVDHEGDETTRAVLLPELYVNEDGWLVGPDVVHVPTERTQRLVHGQPLGFCWHWTATRGVGRRLAENIRKRPKPGERAASWGTLIPAEGPMVQSASLEDGTWHAGGDSAASFATTSNLDAKHILFGPRPNFANWYMTDKPMSKRAKGSVSANSLLHGIEIENAGEVRRVSTLWAPKRGWYKDIECWRAWPFQGQEKNGRGPGPVIPDDEVVELEGRHYHKFTEHQERQAERLVRAARAVYELPESAFRFTHKMIDPSRKSDPEPLWLVHLDAILDRVF